MQILSKGYLASIFTVMVSLSGDGFALSAAPSQSSLTIKLRSYDYANVGNRTMRKVQSEVSGIFKRAGVTIEWVTDDPQLRIFIVEKTADTAASSEDVFGFTPRAPDGAHSSRAYVLYGRVQEFIRDSERWRYPPLNPPQVLAYFIAHEIGHLLLPANSHSAIGIMRDRWRQRFQTNGNSEPLFHIRTGGSDTETSDPVINACSNGAQLGGSDFRIQPCFSQSPLAANRSFLWEEFRKELAGTDINRWMYQGSSVLDRPADLGYYMGYRITQSFYNQAPDKKAAMADVLNIENFQQFLAESRYASRFP